MHSELVPTALIRKWQEGDEAAASELYRRYIEQLLLVARRNLSGRIRTRYDEEEAAHSAFRSLLVRVRDEHFEFRDDEAIWRLLVTITLNKIRNRARDARAQRRDVRMEVAQGQEWLTSGLSRSPAPDEIAEFVDLVDSLKETLSRRGLPDHLNRVLELLIAGCGVSEIAEEIGQTSRSVRRHISRLRELIQQLAAQDSH